jgi:glycosyltransferase involved in cell wall biosynthesis
VYNGIYPDSFKQKEWKKSNKFRIVQIGRLMDDKKGQTILLRAIKLLKERGFSNVYIDFIGDGKSKGIINDYITKLDLKKCTRLLGNQTQTYIKSHLYKYDLLVQPSFREGFGLTVAEGMAAGVPVLVSSKEGPMEIINNGEFGYYFEAGNYKECADKIEYIICHLDERYNKAKKGKERVKQYFDVQSTASQYISHYRRILQSK